MLPQGYVTAEIDVTEYPVFTTLTEVEKLEGPNGEGEDVHLRSDESALFQASGYYFVDEAGSTVKFPAGFLGMEGPADYMGVFTGYPGLYGWQIWNDSGYPVLNTIINAYVYELDLDIDSDNNGGINMSNSVYEDKIEDIMRPGKVIAVNDSDQDNLDGDGIPGFADGYTLDSGDQRGDSPWREEDSGFVMNYELLRIKWSNRWEQWMQDMDVTFTFAYDDNDPKSVVRSGDHPDHVYSTPDTGALRIWTKTSYYDAGLGRTVYARNGESVEEGGDFIPSGVDVDPEDLPFDEVDPSDYATLYVEGVNPTLGSHVIKVTVVIKDGATTLKTLTDEVRVSAVQIKLYRDDAFSKKLDDWATVYKDNGYGNAMVDAEYPRSPKFIFGKDDPIYVEVAGLELAPGVADEINDMVEVVAFHGIREIIELTMKETDDNSCKFRNYPGLGELLYLSTVTRNGHTGSAGLGDSIRVVDEQDVSFNLSYPPKDPYPYPFSCETDVRVDRGEYLAIACSEVDPDNVGFVGWHNAAIDEVQDELSHWACNGYFPARNYVGTYTDADREYVESVRSAWINGADSGHSRSDHICGAVHGGPGYINLVNNTDDTPHVERIAWDDDRDSVSWTSEVEYVVLWVCDFFPPPDGSCTGHPDAHSSSNWHVRSKWWWIRKTSSGIVNEGIFSTGIHGVLATGCRPNSSRALPVFAKYFQLLQSSTDVAFSWEMAMSEYGMPFGLFVRQTNKGDYLLQPVNSADYHITRDNLQTDCIFEYHWWSGGPDIFNGADTHAHQNVVTNAQSGEQSVDIEVDLLDNIRFEGWEIADVYMVDPSGIGSLPVKAAVSEDFDYLSNSKRSVCGVKRSVKTKTKKHIKKKHIKKISKGKARSLASAQAVAIPQDYKFFSEAQLNGITFKGDDEHIDVDPNSIWSEGQVFRYIREINGARLLDDSYTVVVNNDQIIYFSATNNPIKKVGRRKIRKLCLDPIALGIDPNDITTRLSYASKGQSIIPVWEVEYHNRIYRFNASTGRLLYEKD